MSTRSKRSASSTAKSSGAKKRTRTSRSTSTSSSSDAPQPLDGWLTKKKTTTETGRSAGTRGKTRSKKDVTEVASNGKRTRQGGKVEASGKGKRKKRGEEVVVVDDVEDDGLLSDDDIDEDIELVMPLPSSTARTSSSSARGKAKAEKEEGHDEILDGLDFSDDDDDFDEEAESLLAINATSGRGKRGQTAPKDKTSLAGGGTSNSKGKLSLKVLAKRAKQKEKDNKDYEDYNRIITMSEDDVEDDALSRVMDYLTAKDTLIERRPFDFFVDSVQRDLPTVRLLDYPIKKMSVASAAIKLLREQEKECTSGSHREKEKAILTMAKLEETYLSMGWIRLQFIDTACEEGIAKWLFACAAFHPDSYVSTMACKELQAFIEGPSPTPFTLGSPFPNLNATSMSSHGTASAGSTATEWQPKFSDFLDVLQAYGAKVDNFRVGDSGIHLPFHPSVTEERCVRWDAFVRVAYTDAIVSGNGDIGSQSGSSSSSLTPSSQPSSSSSASASSRSYSSQKEPSQFEGNDENEEDEFESMPFPIHNLRLVLQLFSCTLRTSPNLFTEAETVKLMSALVCVMMDHRATLAGDELGICISTLLCSVPLMKVGSFRQKAQKDMMDEIQHHSQHAYVTRHLPLADSTRLRQFQVSFAVAGLKSLEIPLVDGSRLETITNNVSLMCEVVHLLDRHAYMSSINSSQKRIKSQQNKDKDAASAADQGIDFAVIHSGALLILLLIDAKSISKEKEGYAQLKESLQGLDRNVRASDALGGAYNTIKDLLALIEVKLKFCEDAVKAEQDKEKKMKESIRSHFNRVPTEA